MHLNLHLLVLEIAVAKTEMWEVLRTVKLNQTHHYSSLSHRRYKIVLKHKFDSLLITGYDIDIEIWHAIIFHKWLVKNNFSLHTCGKLWHAINWEAQTIFENWVLSDAFWGTFSCLSYNLRNFSFWWIDNTHDMYLKTNKINVDINKSINKPVHTRWCICKRLNKQV